LIGPGRRYHLVGIGGSGMSGLAAVLMAEGVTVSGSDLNDNCEIDTLRRAGAEIHLGHDAAWIHRGLDGVIVSSAIDSQNVEVAAAERQAVPVVRRLHAVGEILGKYRSIGVAGTHGKSTTTAMAATILRETGGDPSYLIGAQCPWLAGNARLGRGEWFVAEVDESDGLFVGIAPTVAVLTNIGKDHLQTYPDLPAIRRAFLRYMEHAERTVLSLDDKNVRALRPYAPGALTVGIDATDAALRATGLRFDRFRSEFDLTLHGVRIGRAVLPAPGEHNVRNALCAVGAALLAGVDPGDAVGALSAVHLPHRRFELLEENGVTVVDDYAHLPDEIEATLRAIRSGWPSRRIVAIFQPHRYSRTKALSEEFGRAFREAHTVVVTAIYPACERPLPGVSSNAIVAAIAAETESDLYSIPGKEEVVTFLRSYIEPGDFIISFGAGDIWTVTEALSNVLKEGAFCRA